jgi:membrane protease YdiL (CAAX protease family)
MRRSHSAASVLLAGLLCAIPVLLLQASFIFMPPVAGFLFELAVTAAAASLWWRWQRRAWRASLPRTAESWVVVLTTALCCTAVAAASHYWVAVQPPPEFARFDAGTPWSKATMLLVAGFTAPLLEEAVFRGFVLGRLRQHFGATASVALSGVTFGMAHGDPSRMVPQIVGGILLGVIVVRTHRLWLAVAAHGAMNLAGTLEGAALELDAPTRLGLFFPALCLLIAALAAIQLRRTILQTRWFIPPRPASLVAPPLTWGLDTLS